jgi:hypothetical protein
MKKPAPGSSAEQWTAYREWVREQLVNWDPADDRGGPDLYVPRYNGVRAADVEGAEDGSED